jgi:hypothetical protein
METREKLREALDILHALLAGKRSPATIVRAHHFIVSAQSDFFRDEDDTATIPMWFEDELAHLD